MHRPTLMHCSPSQR